MRADLTRRSAAGQGPPMGAVDEDGLSGSIASAPPGGRRGRSQPDIASGCATCGLLSTVAHASTARLGQAVMHVDGRRTGAAANTAIGLRRVPLFIRQFVGPPQAPGASRKSTPLSTLAEGVDSPPEGSDGSLSGRTAALRGFSTDNSGFENSTGRWGSPLSSARASPPGAPGVGGPTRREKDARS